MGANGGRVGRVYVLNMATRRGTRLVRVDGRWLFSCRTESRVPGLQLFLPRDAMGIGSREG